MDALSAGTPEDRQRIASASSSESLVIAVAGPEDVRHIMSLQKLAFQSEAMIYQDWALPPLLQTEDELLGETASGVLLKGSIAGRIWATVRGRQDGRFCHIGKLAVHPARQGQGLGSLMLNAIESAFAGVHSYRLFTGVRSASNLRFYQSRGYRVTHIEDRSPLASFVHLEKCMR